MENCIGVAANEFGAMEKVRYTDWIGMVWYGMLWYLP